MSPETYAYINNHLLVFGAGVVVGVIAMQFFVLTSRKFRR